MPDTTTRKITLVLVGGVAVVLAASALTLETARRVDVVAYDVIVGTALALIAFAGGAAALVRRSIARDLARIQAAEEGLRAAEHRFHAIFDQAFQYTMLLTPAGEVVEANETALVFHGGHGRLLGRALWDLPAWSERARASIQAAVEAAAGGAFVRLEESATGGDEPDATFDMSLKAMRDVDGSVTMLIYEARNISQRKAAEAALRASEAKFSGILAIAADAIITVDTSQRIVHFNRGAEYIFGYPASDMIGAPLDVLLPDATRAAHAGHIANFDRAPETARRMGARREVSGRRSNGVEFPAEASISKLDVDGQRLFTVVLRDMTDRRRLEERQRFLVRAGGVLAGSLDYHQTLGEVARLALPTLGDGCIVEVDGTDGMREIAVAHRDREKEETMRELRHVHRPLANAPHPIALVRETRQPMLVSVIDEAFLQRTSAGEEHTRRLRELGAHSAMYVPLVARDHFLGVVSYYCAAPRVFDADDLALASALAQRGAMAIDNARLYEAARRASAARDEVLAVVSHDLRNPLSTIGMCAGALLDPQPISPDGLRSMAETIHLSADWAQRIIRDLLDATTIEAGRLSLERAPLPVGLVLESARGVMLVQAQDVGVELAVTEAGPLPAIDADLERLLQVLLNLVGNALKFTPRGGRVTLHAALDPARPAMVRFSVSDTGAGMAEEDLPHVFDRYWQVHRAGRAGAGLGLAIARGIVEAHGGTISVSSTLGAGSTFEFTIPTVGVAAPPAAYTPSGAHATASR